MKIILCTDPEIPLTDIEIPGPCEDIRISRILCHRGGITEIPSVWGGVSDKKHLRIRGEQTHNHSLLACADIKTYLISLVGLILREKPFVVRIKTLHKQNGTRGSCHI